MPDESHGSADGDGTSPVPRIALRGVTKRFGAITALSDVDLSIDGGTFHCLLGPNGSGKTTLCRIVLGLARPTSGEVVWQTDSIGCGFQRANVYRGLTVAENLSVFGTLLGADDEAWRRELVDALRLERVMDRRAAALSGGYARKLDLALALLDRPDVVLLDEPLGDLDDISKRRLVDLLAAYRDAGNAVLVSTHHVGMFEPLVDRLTVLHGGEVVVDADRADLPLAEADSLQEWYVDCVVALDRRQTADPATLSDR